MASQILRKLTISSTGWTVAAIKAALSTVDKVDLMKVVGITTEARAGQSDKGEFLRLIGQFTAINNDTGEVFEAAACILPNFIADTLKSALASSNEVQFAVLIGAKVNTTSVTGYEFTVKPLIAAAPSAAMQQLLDVAGIVDTPLLTNDAPKVNAAPKKK